MLRRLKNVLTLGGLWGVAWAVLGPAIASVVMTALLARGPTTLGQSVAIVARSVGRTAGSFGLWGFASGLLFAVVVALSEKGRTVKDLSRGRLALWGGLAATFLPLLVLAGAAISVQNAFSPAAPIVLIVLIAGLLGALSASATLALARRGREAEPEHAVID